MKNVSRLFIVMAGFLYAFNISGQTTLGVKGGINIADFSDNSYSSRLSGHGGIYVNRAINKYFAIQPEVLFSGEGLQYTFDNLEHTWALNYIQIPLMLQVSPIKELYIEAGPQVGLLVSAKDKIREQAHVPDIKSLVRNTQFSIGTGIGFRIVDRVTIYGRYNFGLTDITTYDTFDRRSNVAQIGLSVRAKTL